MEEGEILEHTEGDQNDNNTHYWNNQVIVDNSLLINEWKKIESQWRHVSETENNSMNDITLGSLIEKEEWDQDDVLIAKELLRQKKENNSRVQNGNEIFSLNGNFQNRNEFESLFNVFHLFENLKTIKRTGWINHRVPCPESISDHSHRMSLLGLIYQDLDNIPFNRDHLIKLCIIHDIGECIIGDITPHDARYSRDEKLALEASALDTISELISKSQYFNEPNENIVDFDVKLLWHEYCQSSTREAVIAKDLDKFEMILQAFEYEKRYQSLNLDSFFQTTLNAFKTKTVQEWSKFISSNRNPI